MLNRLVLFLFAVVLIKISLIFVLISIGWTIPMDFLSAVYNDFRLRIIIGASGAVVLVLGLYLFLLSLFRQPSQHAVVECTDLGEINISYKALENLLHEASQNIRGVREIKPFIRSAKNGIFLYVKAIIGPEVGLAQASKDLQITLKEALESSAGVKVNDVRVTVTDINQQVKARVR